MSAAAGPIPPDDADETVAALCAAGVAVGEGFLDEAQVRALRDCAALRRERGEFSPARVGAGRTLARREDVRGDSICWVAEPLLPAERELWRSLESLRLAINRRALLGLFELELHYACYAPGTGYARHVDQPDGRGQRRVTLVLYLNEHWQPSDAGQLRIFGEDGSCRDIEPKGGRLVAFLTEGREHEVLAARRERLSLTGWLRTRD